MRVVEKAFYNRWPPLHIERYRMERVFLVAVVTGPLVFPPPNPNAWSEHRCHGTLRPAPSYGPSAYHPPLFYGEDTLNDHSVHSVCNKGSFTKYLTSLIFPPSFPLPHQYLGYVSRWCAPPNPPTVSQPDRSSREMMYLAIRKV